MLMLKLTHKLVIVYYSNRGDKFAEVLEMSIQVGTYQMSN